MKTSIQKFAVSVVISVVTICSLFFTLPGYCQEAKKVAVCPFQMNAAQDLTFLQKGLFSMMSSRLADPGKVEILGRETIDRALEKAQMSADTKGPLNKEKAKTIGKSIGVDYVLFGNLTMFGDSVSLDTTMVDVKGDSPALTFSRQADQPGAVITELDLIATQINQKVFNRQEEDFIPQAKYVQAAPQQPQYQNNAPAGAFSNHRVLFSTNGEIIGMACGDVDGDKENEVVIIYAQMIEILKDNNSGQLVSIEKIEEGQHMDLVGVDVADINRNGVEELFITRVHRDTGHIRSYVLEKENDAYKNISGDLPWYLRVVKTVSEKKELFAQKSGIKGPYKADSVFRVVWSNDEYLPGEKLRVPVGFSVMSMSAAANVGGVDPVRLFTDQSGRMRLFKENGAVEWSGEKGYGGSKIFYEFKEFMAGEDEIIDNAGAYFQPRSLLRPATEGDQQVVVIKNKDFAGDWFGKLRGYKNGDVELHVLNQMGLSPIGSSLKIPGQITDIAIDEVQNTGEKALLVSFIKKSVNYSSKRSKSMIVGYDMK